jgi:hypothetical protein
MRKVLLAGLIVMMGLVSSCATLNKEYLKSVQNVALVTVMCDKHVDMSEFSGIASVVSHFAQFERFSLKPICLEIKNNIFGKNASKFPFHLIPENKIITTDGYRALTQTFLHQFGDTLQYDVPDGYTSVQYNNDSDLEQIFNKIPQADGTMIVLAKFHLRKGMEILGFGSAKIRTRLGIVVKNRQNKDVINAELLGESQHEVRYALGGAFDAADVQPLCLEAVQDALFQFDKWVQSNL